MKNIHILPTDKRSRLANKDSNNKLELSEKNTFFVNGFGFTPQNIYITNDEEIKEGDWVIYKEDNSIIKMKTKLSVILGHSFKTHKKIILTTDQDLIKDGVQAIDDEFLEWFVNNRSCEEVEVKMNQGRYFDYGGNVHITNAYKIIIPKEEPKKVLIEEDIFNQKDIDAVTDYINKEQQKKILIDMMKDDEELGLYGDIKANRIELVCKDCSDSLEDCTCIEDTIDFPKQEDEFCYYSGLPSPTAYSKQEIKLEDIFNDDKKENIKKFIDEINNPSQPNQALIDAAERYIAGDDYNRYYDDFINGARWQSERSYSEEEVIAFGEFIFKHSLLTHAKGVKSLFEQFKNK